MRGYSFTTRNLSPRQDCPLLSDRRTTADDSAWVLVSVVTARNVKKRIFL